MAEEYKSSKTRQVINLINSKPSGVNPFLPPAEQEREKKSLAESTVEDKLRTYTQSKDVGILLLAVNIESSGNYR